MATGKAMRKDDAAAHSWKGAPKVRWPAAASADVELSGASGTSRASAREMNGQTRRVGSLPVSLSMAGTKAERGAPVNRSDTSPLPKARVTVADLKTTRKAGVDGVMLSVSGNERTASGSALNVAVDYSGFRAAYGGDWAARLQLVQLPVCAMTTPDKAECRSRRALVTKNDTEMWRLSAAVKLLPRPAATRLSGAAAASGATVLAVTAASGGSSGDFKATPLEASGSWSAGGSTGALSWNYPIKAPAVPGGLQPSVELGYNSQSVDGRTAASNNQPSWLGDGWAYEPGFIERRYKSCEADKTGGTNTTKAFDQCWYSNNATLSLGGKSTELVYDASKGWHPEADSGEKVEKLTGATNGDNDGEHWKVTTTDGTQYFFGLNRLPGWKDNGTASDDPVTNSAWTVPVFGNQTGEPCYNATFANGWCQQAWRWQSRLRRRRARQRNGVLLEHREE
ncbi:hypothetical protein [Streptomyces sp. MS2.AVA.5]|uniref:Uncharacterized protein n=1 Tax=Streptomyces achmelvichensis TaxID=3134111 RepID=A0ACC6Q994_9ACTN